MKYFWRKKKRCWKITLPNYSTDLEIINSRIILFKDIQWILEKDILDNFAKIIDLSGAKKITALNPAAFKKIPANQFITQCAGSSGSSRQRFRRTANCLYPGKRKRHGKHIA